MADPIVGRLLPVAGRALRSASLTSARPGALGEGPKPIRFRTVEPMANPAIQAPSDLAPGTTFVEMLRAEVGKVNTEVVAADDASRALVTGTSGDIHGTMISLTKAELAFRLMTQVRNKAIEAYQEIMRMPL